MASEKTVTNLNNGFTELWTSVLTPLNPDLSIDTTKYISHVKALLENGSKGVCIFDATGEGASFSCSERQALLDELIKEKIPSKSLLVCTTAASIEDTRTLTLNAVSQNVYGCLMGAPFFYNKSSNQGIINSYAYIFNSIPEKNWFMYIHNNPAVNCGAIPHAVISELIRLFPTFISGIVDASENLSVTTELVRSFLPSCMVYTQHEKDILKVMDLNSTGALSFVANLLPRQISKAITRKSSSHAMLANDLIDLVIGHHPKIPACKSILSLLHHNPQWLLVRPPFVSLGKEALADISKNLKKFALDHEMKFQI
jgi:4-hydroxy-tetrahydrodipicolinate synthase